MQELVGETLNEVPHVDEDLSSKLLLENPNSNCQRRGEGK